jgi:hypothetical protein
MVEDIEDAQHVIKETDESRASQEKPTFRLHKKH